MSLQNFVTRGVPFVGGGVSLLNLLRSFTDAAPGRGYWDHQEPSGAVLGAYNSALDLGRDVVINGDFASDTIWTKGANWTIAAGVATHAAGATADLSQDGIAAAGKTWQLTYTISGRTAGSVTAKLGASFTARSTNATFVETITATSADLDFTPTSDFDGNIDDVILQQTNILASSAYPGAEAITDGDMEAADTSAWTPISSATLTKETGTRTGGSGVLVLRIARNGVNNPTARQVALTVGKRYRLTAWSRSDGNAVPRISNGGTTLISGTNSTSWQFFEREFTAVSAQFNLVSTTSTGTEYTEWDDVSVTIANPLNGDHTGVTVGQSATPALGLAVLDDGATSVSDVLSTELNSIFDPTLWTQGIFAKVINAGVWTDNTLRVLLNYEVDANNYLRLSKNTSNELQWDYKAGGTLESVVLAVTPSDYFSMWITVNAAGNMTAYYNGVITGAPQAIAGTWVGNLTVATIGAINTAPASVWDGFRTHVPGMPIEDSGANILQIAQAGGVA